MINRTIEQRIHERLFKGKAIILLGARQVGKTTLLRKMADSLDVGVQWLNADNPEHRSVLNTINTEKSRKLFSSGSVLVIDEAQRLENTGLSLKIIHDACPGVQLIATGSSAFELSDKLKEPMTGRKWSMHLHPLSIEEIEGAFGALHMSVSLEDRLRFGAYPDVINRPGDEIEVLTELTSDYLYKDVFALRDLRKPDALEKLVQALAFQVGNQVSYRELGEITGLDKGTTERYIRLLEEAFVIFRLPSFSRNLRNELKRSRKIYFCDLGVRNAVIGRFEPLDLRDDIGVLWENFLIAERRKYLDNHRFIARSYFWRTHAQAEIDYLEEADGKLSAYEFKWNPKRNVRIPLAFRKGYPDAPFNVITRENYFEFVTPQR